MNHSATPTTAVLLHGLCSTPDELKPVENALRAAGHRVLALSVPGYSFDAALFTQRATLHAQWLAHVAGVVRQQQALGQRVVLVGLSAGAALALGTAMQCVGAVHGLVLMSTTLQFDGWAVPRHHKLLPLALYTPLGRFWRYREQPPYGVKNVRVRRWIERELATRRVSSAGAAVIGVPHLREHDRLRRAVRRMLDRFDCPPVLVLHALEDEVASPANVVLLQRGLRTPSLRAVLLPNSHHMITIDNDRLQVVKETLCFVDGVAAAPDTTIAAVLPAPARRESLLTMTAAGETTHGHAHL